MSPEDRRKMIIQAVLPLIAEHGSAVTTAQIARTAGIGEGTIFRAFKDKDELVEACVFEATRPDGMLELLSEIPLDEPLEKRLADAADVLSAHLERLGAIAGAIHRSGTRKRGQRGDRKASFEAMRAALAELFEPEREKLRLSPGQLGGIFLSLLLSRSRDDQAGLGTGALIDVFLHGAVKAQ
ncbi:TetR/AcrR family transcriptional regulator [Amycolatopsis alkalitolerans]|uniref:TetR family transcriptional regulator n=1 Tax=Amycolatopsis alkalitolerans TaxID=2547244 RepID=A0A5C4M4I4_9PSEU|nr:TetR family transcriptional regulator [Amycolatopsis alkalitolerans]TNC27479.1 TetR family transcriptional regulator [Amycolatopsis alkalitolerans]